MYNKESAGGNPLRQVPRPVMLRRGDKCLGEVQSWSHRVCEREASLPVPFLNARRDGIQEGALHDQKA